MSSSKAETIRGIFAAYLANDRKTVEDSFTSDFRFTSPYDDEIDKTTYFERCWRVSDWIERHEIERIFVEAAFVGLGQAFVKFQIEDLKAQGLRCTNLFRAACEPRGVAGRSVDDQSH